MTDECEPCHVPRELGTSFFEALLKSIYSNFDFGYNNEKTGVSKHHQLQKRELKPLVP